VKTLNKWIFCLYIIVTLTPILSSCYIQMALVVLWGLTIIPVFQYVEKDWKLFIFAWIGYAIILRVIGFSTASWGNYGIYVLFYYPLFVFAIYRHILNDKEKHCMVNFIMAVALLNMLYNICFLIRHPGANQELNFSDMYAGCNLGNSDFTFVIMLVLIIYLYYAIHGRIIYFLAVVLGCFYLVISSKTTALLVFLIITYIIFVEKFAAKIEKRQRILIECLGIILPLLLYKPVLIVMSHFISNQYIVERLNALIVGDTSSVYLSRAGLAKISFHTFLNHPVLGIGYVKADFSKIDYVTTGIGHHSEFIDHLGRYGLIGAVAYIFIWYNYFKTFNSYSGTKKDHYAGIMIFIAFMMYSLLNNSMDAMSGVVIFYLVSSVADGDFGKKKYQ